jgi:hypothetical protein
MALPEGDFALCMDLIPQKTQSDATITALSTLASHLEVRCGARCSWERRTCRRTRRTCAPARWRGLLVMNTYLATAETPLPEGFLQWRAMCRGKPDFAISRLFSRGNPQMSEAACAAYDAPFPGPDFRAATRAFPDLVPEHAQDDGAAVSREAAAFWADSRPPTRQTFVLALPVTTKSSQDGDGTPFFAYVSHQAPHDPYHLPKAWRSRHVGEYDKGWDAVRKARLAKASCLLRWHSPTLACSPP